MPVKTLLPVFDFDVGVDSTVNALVLRINSGRPGAPRDAEVESNRKFAWSLEHAQELKKLLEATLPKLEAVIAQSKSRPRH